MRMHKLISAGFAATALATASIPALALGVWPDVDFEWYANVGKQGPVTVELMPPARAGYVYAPGHWETQGTRQVWVAGAYHPDNYQQQVAIYRTNGTVTASTGPLPIYDSQGNPIPLTSDSYNIDSARR